MGIKSALSVPFAKFQVRGIKRWSANPIKAQDRVLKYLLRHGKTTAFGVDHHLAQVDNYTDFKKAVPLRDYEDLKGYFDRIIAGESNVLWKGKPIYLCKTSGTTSGNKFIPITRASMPNHIGSARNALLSYIAETGNSGFVNGKMIFLQGSPILDTSGSIPVGRLSGIAANHVPAYLLKNRMPSYKTNCIEDWETKLDAIVEETHNENMTLISGIPAWVQMYFEKLLEKTGKKTIKEIFPNFSLFVYGGVNYEPYRSMFEATIGGKVDALELFPASEGFFAFQDTREEEGMLLIVNSGIFYEFVKLEHIHEDNPERISLADVELGVNYAMILNTNAGLWGYNIGDTVKFVSKDPYRVIVSGRIKHFISAFGEHVIAEEVESAIREAIELQQLEVTEFHVAPQVTPTEGLPYHEWFIEFKNVPENVEQSAEVIDKILQKKNSYYRDLLEGNVLRGLRISKVEPGGFVKFMKLRGKLGGQNKIPRLANERTYADELANFVIE
ncbi:MAG: GH3 auxin-responsive promoter family protein [Flavobacteriales bacterium]|nr:GH3 auxin-responsive promoter family protein [Flavobacteriales bacterium]